jgi:hypothetical protein
VRQVHLLDNLFHQHFHFLSESIVLDWSFIESKRDFLGSCVLCKISCQRRTKLMDQVVCAKGGTGDILDVDPMAPSVDAHSITHNMLHHIVMDGTTKQQPGLVQQTLTELKTEGGYILLTSTKRLARSG